MDPHRRTIAAGRTRQRKINSQAALREMRRGPTSIPEIARTIKISRPAARDIVASLLDDGWVVELSTEESTTAGRPAKTYAFDAMQGKLLGLDIGAHTIRVRLADLDGNDLETSIIKVSPDAAPDSRLQASFQAIDTVLNRTRTAIEDVWAIGIASPGVIQDGVVKFYGGPDMPGWVTTNLSKTFEQKYQVATFVEGDSAAGALGEIWKGGHQNPGSLVYILAGYRVGFGLVINNHLIRGNNGAAGLLGEMPEIGWSQLDQYPHPAHTGPEAQDPPELDQEMFANYCKNLAQGIRAIALTIDPETIVIGGGIGLSQAPLLHEINKQLDGKLISYPTITSSTIGELGVLHGTIKLALQSLEDTIFSPTITNL